MARSTLRRKRFGPEVASCVFVFQWDGQKRRVRARVGKPYRVSSREWACPVEIRGFERRYLDPRGADSMQALCHAIYLLRARFEAFLEDGGRVLDVDHGSEWDVNGVMATFGPMRPSANQAEARHIEDPQFLNIDLDVRSRRSLAPLVAAWPWSYQPPVAENRRNPHWLTLNPRRITPRRRTAERATKELLGHVRRLRGEARRSWNHARVRVFDIGVQAGGPGRACEDVQLTAETLRQIAFVGAQVKVTVYPAQPQSPVDPPPAVRTRRSAR